MLLELILNFDEVGISEWEAWKSKKIIIPSSRSDKAKAKAKAKSNKLDFVVKSNCVHLNRLVIRTSHSSSTIRIDRFLMKEIICDSE
jgi:hypothetical protein